MLRIINAVLNIAVFLFFLSPVIATAQSNTASAIINNTETFPQYAAIKGVGDEGGEFVFIMR